MLDPKDMPNERKIQYIVEVMKMRARGRPALMLAEQKRRQKRKQKSSKDWHKYVGEIHDEEYGAKPIQRRLYER